ncbi:hypothetical protein SAMN05216436_10122 [bacterium A37T11]|nr:hypothetical protein SAMN05216436_10122 [bacterium A37T11]
MSKQCKHINKNVLNIFSVALLLLLFFPNELSAQSKKKEKEKPELEWLTKVTIDGKLDEWKDSLSYLYDSQKLRYSVANNGFAVFVAMRVSGMDKQIQALSQGFSFMVNTDGKKKPGPRVVFPIPDRESLRAIMSADNENRPKDMREGALKAIRSFYVVGFNDIVDGQISLENQYGIRAAVAIDSTDALCFEAVIPLQRLDISSNSGKELAFNVKINGVIMPSRNNLNPYGRGMYPYGYGYGYPYGYGQSERSGPKEEPGIWFTAKLKQESR